jgi:polyhydroxybutyrate depolymerase
MEQSWFRYSESVAFLRDRNVLQGYPDGTFKPDQTINRAEFLKIVLKGKGGSTPIDQGCFSDVAAGEWYAPFVCAAARRDIVNGYPDGTFKPSQPVNTAEAIKIVLGAYERHVEEPLGEFWYAPYIQELNDKGILPDHSYIPGDELTRERAADLIARMLRYEEERITLRRSSGCGKPFSQILGPLIVNGVERSYLLTVPDNYNASEPSPLIVAFHGRTNSNDEVRSYFGLDRAADEFFIAYPAALPNGNSSFSWTSQGSPWDRPSDIDFFDGIVETLAEHYCIDMDRIFVAGHSLGAWMANSVACIRGDVVRASGTVGGDSVFTDCVGPAAALIIHNPHDRLSPFSGAERLRDMRLQENACSGEPEPIEPVSLKCAAYSSCSAGNVVYWCPHEQDIDWSGAYYPHNWPKETAETITAFFRSME